jgi:hypothetical protein
MLVMWTIEDTTKPVGELVSFRQPLGLDHFALAVYPLGLYGVQPRTLLGQKAAYDPHSTATVFDSAVILAEPASDLLGDLHFPAAERTLFYLSEMNSLLNSRSHRTELATATHTSQSPRFRLTVPNAGCWNVV